MNDKIKALIAPHMMHERFSRYGESTEEDYYEFYPDELEQFIKAIVQECADIITSQDVDPAFKNRMAWAIKEYFGIE